jgi:hypothetical protein
VYGVELEEEVLNVIAHLPWNKARGSYFRNSLTFFFSFFFHFFLCFLTPC